MKTCSRCFDTLPVTHFYYDPRNADGRKNHCRTCHNTHQKTTIIPVGKRCLHSGCYREGEAQPEGHGFRFCDKHLPDWEKVRDRTGAPLSTQSERRAKRFRRCARGHKIIGNNITPGRRSCRACENTRHAARRDPIIDQDEYAAKKYHQYLGAAK